MHSFRPWPISFSSPTYYVATGSSVQRRWYCRRSFWIVRSRANSVVVTVLNSVFTYDRRQHWMLNKWRILVIVLPSATMAPIFFTVLLLMGLLGSCLCLPIFPVGEFPLTVYYEARKALLSGSATFHGCLKDKPGKRSRDYQGWVVKIVLVRLDGCDYAAHEHGCCGLVVIS